MKASEAEVLQRPGLTAAAGALRRDEHVNFRLRAIAHVVDEVDGSPQVVHVALPAIEIHAQHADGRGRAWRRLLRLRGERRGRDRDETEQHRENAAHQLLNRGLTLTFESDPKLYEMPTDIENRWPVSSCLKRSRTSSSLASPFGSVN